MSMEDDLHLREVRLKTTERWTNQGPGLWFIFPKTGAGEFVSGTVRWPLSSKELLLVNVEAVITILPVGGSEFLFRCFRVGLETLFPLLACREIPQLRVVADLLKTGKSYSIGDGTVAQCLALLETVPSAVNLEHRVLLLRVVATLLSAELRAHEGEPIPGSSAAQRTIQVLGQLSAVELANSSTNELARKFGCSRRHLNRLFRAQFGLSIGALRMEVRLLKAIALLRDPQAKILAVATEAGFTHLGLFNYYFKRRFGLSPSQWRKTAFASPSKPALTPIPLHLLSTQDSSSLANCRLFN